MVLTDGTHLVASTIKELHEFAARIGLKRQWFQAHPRHPHYDLTSRSAYEKAMRAGAVRMSSDRDLCIVLPLLQAGELWERYLKENVLDGEPPNAPWGYEHCAGVFLCHFCGGEYPAHEPGCLYLLARMCVVGEDRLAEAEGEGA
jgi:hypothetical protein